MRKSISLIFLLALGMLLVACSGQEEQLTRVDVQKINQEGNYEDAVIMITEQEKIDLIRNSFKNVNWESNTKADMSRKEDVLVTFFYTFDKNMPERLYEYRIWFNENGTATLISNIDKEGYGTLDKDNSQVIKNVLLK